MGEIDFRDLFIEGAMQAWGEDNLQANLTAGGSMFSRVRSHILKRAEADLALGRSPILTPVGRTMTRVRSPTESVAGKRGDRVRERLQSRPAVLRSIDQLTDREFEALGVLCLRASRAVKCYVTPKGNEAGVDFVGLLPMDRRRGISYRSSDFLRVIGQSKKYSGPVAVGALKEFTSTLSDAFYGSKKISDVLPAWFHDSRGPIVGWVMGHSGFQDGAKKRAKSFGITLYDSVDIAEHLVLGTGRGFLAAPSAVAARIRQECAEEVRA